MKKLSDKIRFGLAKLLLKVFHRLLPGVWNSEIFFQIEKNTDTNEVTSGEVRILLSAAGVKPKISFDITHRMSPDQARTWLEESKTFLLAQERLYFLGGKHGRN